MDVKRTTLGYPITLFPVLPAAEEPHETVIVERLTPPGPEPAATAVLPSEPRVDQQVSARRRALPRRESLVAPIVAGALVMSLLATVGWSVWVRGKYARPAISAASAAVTVAAHAMPPAAPGSLAPAVIVQKIPYAASPGVGSCNLHVESNPSGGEVWVDDKPIGTAPLDLPNQRCGWPLHVVVRHAQYAPWSKMVSTREGDVTPVAATLKRPKTWLTIESTPPGAQIRLNGKDAGLTPTRLEVKAFSPAVIELHKAGFAPTRQTEQPDLDGHTTVRAKLQPASS